MPFECLMCGSLSGCSCNDRPEDQPNVETSRIENLPPSFLDFPHAVREFFDLAVSLGTVKATDMVVYGMVNGMDYDTTIREIKNRASVQAWIPNFNLLVLEAEKVERWKRDRKINEKI